MSENNGWHQTSFTDSAGDVWELEITYASLRRVYLKTGLKLEEILREGTDSYKRVQEDEWLLTDAICVLLETQLEKRNLSVEQFAERLKNRVQIEAVNNCLMRAIVLFIQPGDRAWLPMALDRHLKAMDKIIQGGSQAAIEAVEATDWEAVAKRSIASLAASSSPASAESIPDHSHSENLT